MRAITYSQFGPAETVLGLQDLPTPDPASGEVLVRLSASGVNPSDTKARAGGRPGVTAPPFPLIIPHSDGAGEIVGLGEGVPAERLGQRVWLWNAQWRRAFGTAAEYIALPAAQAVPLPEPVSYATGAVLGIPGLTATQAVLGAGPVAGKRVLVSGGAGTVGYLAVQIARHAGAEVIATARGAANLEKLRQAGASHVFDYSAPDLAAEILEATGGALIDHVVEVEFGQNAGMIAEVIAENGHIAAYGSARNMTPEIPFYPLMFKAVCLQTLLIYILPDAARAKAIAALHDLLTQGALDIPIAASLPLAQCARAHDMVTAGGRAGAVILDPTVSEPS